MTMTIDTCYEYVVSKLSRDLQIEIVSLQLLSLTSNDERVLFVYDILDSMNAFPTTLKVSKADHVSAYYRNLGNECFQKKNDYGAWQYYNLSLLHAPLDSENYSLAIANRSAVLFSLKKYKGSLQDVNLTLSMNYPERLKDKLVKRQALCKEHIAKETNSENEIINEDVKKILTMEQPRQDKYPCASSKLEVVYTSQMGRHIIAKEDIKVGELLIQENPYFALVLKSQQLFSCSYCLSRDTNLLPCDHCCFTLYCSTDCKQKAWKDYHSVECSLMPILIEWKFTKLELLGLRTVIKARNDYPNWESLFKTIAELDHNTCKDLRVSSNDEYVYDSKYYNSIHTLASNIEKRGISDIFQKSITAAVFLQLLSEQTEFMWAGSEEQSEKIRDCVAQLLLHHIMTSPTNMHGLSTNTENNDGNFVEEISLASAPYAFLSLLNHSCSPNVVRCDVLGTSQMNLYALRPIKKGMQLFDNYGAHHALQDRSTRQDYLRFQYKFACMCEACVDDWPLYIAMKPAENLPSEVLQLKERLLDSDSLKKLQLANKGTALQLFKPLCELTEVLDSYAPCVELADCQEALKQCLIIFGGVLERGYNDYVSWAAIPPIEI